MTKAEKEMLFRIADSEKEKYKKAKKLHTAYRANTIAASSARRELILSIIDKLKLNDEYAKHKPERQAK